MNNVHYHQSNSSMTSKAKGFPQAKTQRHNFPILETIFLSFMIFLFTGLALFSFIHYFQDHILITTGLKPSKDVARMKQFNHLSHPDREGWERVHIHGDVAVYKKIAEREQEQEDKTTRTHYSPPIYLYHHKSNLPMHAFLDILNDPHQAMDWFAYLIDKKYQVKKHEPKVYEELMAENLDLLPNDIDLHMILRPYLRLHDREFATHLTSFIDTEGEDYDPDTGSHGERTVVTFLYRNIEDRDDVNVRPICPTGACVKGNFDMILRLTTHDEGNTTEVEMELDMDFNPSKKIPKFLLDNLTMRWGVMSIHKLVKICRWNLGLESMVDFKASLYNLVPIKH